MKGEKEEQGNGKAAKKTLENLKKIRRKEKLDEEIETQIKTRD